MKLLLSWISFFTSYHIKIICSSSDGNALNLLGALNHLNKSHDCNKNITTQFDLNLKDPKNPLSITKDDYYKLWNNSMFPPKKQPIMSLNCYLNLAKIFVEQFDDYVSFLEVHSFLKDPWSPCYQTLNHYRTFKKIASSYTSVAINNNLFERLNGSDKLQKILENDIDWIWCKAKHFYNENFTISIESDFELLTNTLRLFIDANNLELINEFMIHSKYLRGQCHHRGGRRMRQKLFPKAVLFKLLKKLKTIVFEQFNVNQNQLIGSIVTSIWSIWRQLRQFRSINVKMLILDIVNELGDDGVVLSELKRMQHFRIFEDLDKEIESFCVGRYNGKYDDKYNDKTFGNVYKWMIYELNEKDWRYSSVYDGFNKISTIYTKAVIQGRVDGFYIDNMWNVMLQHNTQIAAHLYTFRNISKLSRLLSNILKCQGPNGINKTSLKDDHMEIMLMRLLNGALSSDLIKLYDNSEMEEILEIINELIDNSYRFKFMKSSKISKELLQKIKSIEEEQRDGGFDESQLLKN